MKKPRSARRRNELDIIISYGQERNLGPERKFLAWTCKVAKSNPCLDGIAAVADVEALAASQILKPSIGELPLLGAGPVTLKDLNDRSICRSTS